MKTANVSYLISKLIDLTKTHNLNNDISEESKDFINKFLNLNKEELCADFINLCRKIILEEEEPYIKRRCTMFNYTTDMMHTD